MTDQMQIPPGKTARFHPERPLQIPPGASLTVPHPGPDGRTFAIITAADGSELERIPGVWTLEPKERPTDD